MFANYSAVLIIMWVWGFLSVGHTSDNIKLQKAKLNIQTTFIQSNIISKDPAIPDIGL